MAYDDRYEDEEYCKWAKVIKISASFCCQICGKRGVYLESHHLNAWHSYPKERYKLSNGVCICATHHRQFHEIYGSGENTKWQYEQFVKIYKTLCKVLSKKENVENTFFNESD
jgi:predicted restriction endonuclease